MSDIRKWFSPVSTDSNMAANTNTASSTSLSETEINESVETREIVVYTDGSAINNGSSKAKGGSGVFFGDNDPRNISKSIIASNGEAKVTNNICELYAVKLAIEKIIETEPSTIGVRIVLFTDSEYIVKSVLQYSKAWEKNGYKNKRGQPIKNMDLMKRVIELYKKYNVKLHHCPAHKSEPRDKAKRKVWYGNKMADYLARKASS